MSLSLSHFPSDMMGRGGAKMLGNLDCDMSSAGFLFNSVELGALACIIAANGFVPRGSATEWCPPGAFPS